MTNPHKLYGSAIALVVLGVVVASAWSSHVRDEARRDAVIDSQKTEISKLEQAVKDSAAAAREQIASLEKQKQVVIQQPSQAPTIIREQIPFSTPVVQTAPITKETLPDAPVAQLTRQQEQELATFALSCKQCAVDREALTGQVSLEQQEIDRQKVELEAAKKSAKGGSVLQRAKRNGKWALIGGASALALEFIFGRKR